MRHQLCGVVIVIDTFSSTFIFIVISSFISNFSSGRFEACCCRCLDVPTPNAVPLDEVIDEHVSECVRATPTDGTRIDRLREHMGLDYVVVAGIVIVRVLCSLFYIRCFL